MRIGYGGARIKGWLILPATRQGPLPCVLEYIGYGGGRGLLVERLLWASAGFAHFVMDNRGQGSDGPPGATADESADAVSPHYPGFMTMGIHDPAAYYYRRLFSDAVRALDAVRTLPQVDPTRVTAYGRSQGSPFSDGPVFQETSGSQKGFSFHGSLSRKKLSGQVDRTQIPMVNKWLLSGQSTWAGDPKVASFAAATRVAINEMAKVTSGVISTDRYGPCASRNRRWGFYGWRCPAAGRVTSLS